MISVDSNILNYSTFYPGKMLGSTLSVGNLSDCEQIVELSVDSGNLSYEKKMIREKFEDAQLPFSLDSATDAKGKKNDSISNSESSTRRGISRTPSPRSSPRESHSNLAPRPSKTSSLS